MRRLITHPVKAIRSRFTYPYSQSYVQNKRTISLEDTLIFFYLILAIRLFVTLSLDTYSVEATHGPCLI